MTKTTSILVTFKEELPKKNKKWWEKLDGVIGPKNLREKIKNQRLFFIDITELIDPGNIKEAHRLTKRLSRITSADGSRISKSINYRGYEIWWMHYDDFMHKFCFPYTQYHRLLAHLKNFNNTYLYGVSHPSLFQWFLSAHKQKCVVLKEPNVFYWYFKKIFLVPPGILIQLILSIGFLIWLKITRPKLMVWSSDRFAPPHLYDFRMRFICEELKKRKIPFVEFIRSQESSITIIQHALMRKRPVVYSAAIISFLHSLTARFFKKRKKPINLAPGSKAGPEYYFWFLVATDYLNNITGTIWSIRAMEFIFKWIGTKAVIVPAACNRTFHEVLSAKLNNIKTVGIQHGATPYYFFVSDFMSGFGGKLPLSVDRYGLWSNWWREYFITHSRAYRPEQLYISGHMRPLEKKVTYSPKLEKGPIKVLFISEELAAPSEVIPYLSHLLEAEDISVFVKFRSYRDGFEEWLKKNQPDTLEKIRILRGNIHDAIAQSDVIVGCHSTAVFEALLQLKPLVFFRTNKWEDHFNIKSFNTRHCFFAESPQELIVCIRKSVNIPREVLRQLQNQFFGDPNRNGSKWVVDQAEEFLKL